MDPALQLIQQAKTTQATTLDLGNCALNSLPESIYELKELEVLILADEFQVWNGDAWIPQRSNNNGSSNTLTHLSSRISRLSKLKKLFLNNNPIADISFLKYLKKLQELGLAETKIKDTAPIIHLRNLKTLDLRRSQITDIDALSELRQLQQLCLQETYVQEIDALAELTKLDYLYCGRTGIYNLAPLKNLTGLKQLHLSGTAIADLQPLSGIPGLEVLDLTGTMVENLIPIRQLTGLQALYLRQSMVIDLQPLRRMRALVELNLEETRVESLAPLENMSNLKILKLQETRVKELAPLKALKKLQILNIHQTSVSDITSLSGLTNLKELDLSQTRIKTLEPLRALTGLKRLNAQETDISDLSPIKDLSKMEYLYLWRTQVQKLTPLSKLTGLRQIYLQSTQVKDLTPLVKLKNLEQLHLQQTDVEDLSPLAGLKSLESLFLAETLVRDLSPLSGLRKLKHLDISGTAVEHIDPLSSLRQLRQCYLNGTNVTDISPLLPLFETGLEPTFQTFGNGLRLEGLKLKVPPLEIVRQGSREIINYLKQFDKQTQSRLYEAKVLIVGEPGAGKTSLQKKLIDPTYNVPNENEEDATVGINIAEGWSFVKNGQQYLANLWDFGGQEIQYMTHQFFLTPRSLYILVADDRRQDTNFDYWFRVINLLGRGLDGRCSPILVVLNENRHRSITNFDLNTFRETFSDITIECFSVDLSNADGRVKALRKKIQQMVTKLTHMGDVLPGKWILIRKQLEKLRKKHNHIDFLTYEQICKKQRLSKSEDQLVLSRYFHNLGLSLHFQQESTLSNFIILNPQWVVDAVYSILKDNKVKLRQGQFTREDLDEYWKEYNFLERNNLLNLMLKDNFEICYRLSREKGGKYLAPQLLENVRPSLELNDPVDLRFRFQYPFMPKGLISRLIVRLHEIIVVHESISQVWKTGMVVSQDDCFGLIMEKETIKEGLKVIDIEIHGSGPNAKYLLRKIRDETEYIHKKSFPHLRYSKMVPCHCGDCLTSEVPSFFDYDLLLKCQSQNITQITCFNAEIKQLKVITLLEGVLEKKEVEQILHQFPLRDVRDNSEMILKIKDEIVKNDLKKVFDLLHNMGMTTTQYDELLLLKAQYRDWSKEKIAGTLSGSDAQLRLNQIRQKLVLFLNNLSNYEP